MTKEPIFLNPNKEHREWLITAIGSALRWYATSSERRKTDDKDAIILIDLMQELQQTAN